MLGAGTAHALESGRPRQEGGSAAGGAAKDKAAKQVNDKLLAEGRKNQCSFKSDSDQLEPGCDKKVKKLADALVDAKKRLDAAGVNAYKFEVSGHTDSSGKADHNKELSAKRAAVIVKELVARGIAPEGDRLRRHGLRAPARHPRRHGREEGQEPSLRDPGEALARSRRGLSSLAPVLIR